MSANGSALTSGNPAAPQGSQVAFLHDQGAITQSVANWGGRVLHHLVPGGDAGQLRRGGQFNVLVDGVVVGSFVPPSTSYQAYQTAPFTVVAGSHTIEFLALNTAGGDDTDFLDAVSIQAAPTISSPTVGDSNFQQAPAGSTGTAYDPSGSPWSFAGTSGVSANGSALTSGNGAAPQGSQVGFVQGTGSITQAVANWSAGTYAIVFQAAMGANTSTMANPEAFTILVDGSAVGTFVPLSTPYQRYSTANFTVSAGSHTIQVVGINGKGGTAADLLESVLIV